MERLFIQAHHAAFLNILFHRDLWNYIFFRSVQVSQRKHLHPNSLILILSA
jgi:hypothetical protein